MFVNRNEVRRTNDIVAVSSQQFFKCRKCLSAERVKVDAFLKPGDEDAISHF